MCNGNVERHNRKISNMLRKFCELNPNCWWKVIPLVMLMMNSRVQTASGFSANQLTFGYDLNPFTDWANTKTETEKAEK